MDANSTSERVSDAIAAEGIKVIDIDTHLSEPLDLWTSRATLALDPKRTFRYFPAREGRRWAARMNA